MAKKKIDEDIDDLTKDAETGCEINEDEENNSTGTNKLTDLINAINNTLHGLNKNRKGAITKRQYLAISKAKAFNDYMEKNYNYRYEILDSLCANVIDYSVSEKGLGFLTSAEALKGLNTSVELQELKGSQIRDRLGR
jgi:hypothetical protein